MTPKVDFEFPLCYIVEEMLSLLKLPLPCGTMAFSTNVGASAGVLPGLFFFAVMWCSATNGRVDAKVLGGSVFGRDEHYNSFGVRTKAKQRMAEYNIAFGQVSSFCFLYIEYPINDCYTGIYRRGSPIRSPNYTVMPFND